MKTLENFNFIDIFSRFVKIEIKQGDKTVDKNIRVEKIIIPIIQRDYAQGRNTTTIKRVRENFLSALYDAVTKKPITLDFIYGDLDERGILIPLDGQQRLTTLFLLHWYTAKKEKISENKTGFLKNFSYETRPDSREFCKQLIEFQPKFDQKTLSKEIQDQEWFPLSWEKDPTISAMLKMLDAIHEKFRNVKNLWKQLENNAISFYFQPISNIGLTDEIYITMNSRGKLLTEFERFKAEFKNHLDKIDAQLSNKIIRKIDIDWTDLLWKYRDEDNLIDNGFLNYFRFVCDILLYKNNQTTQGRNRDAMSLLDEFFNGDVHEKIAFMENAFNCWCGMNIDDFFDSVVSRGSRTKKDANKHQSGKFITYFDNVNFFEDCVRAKNFSLGKTLMLYAFLVYLMNKDKISNAAFRRRIRVVNNLVNNSINSEISDSENRQGGNRMPAMLKQIDSIILTGKIIMGKIIMLSPNFNVYQLEEEQAKLEWAAENPNDAESLFALEDHYLLCGQIGVVGLKNPQNFARFISLFECDYDLIDCAILARGDYFQNKKQLYQFGSKNQSSWQNLFHRSSYNENFEGTQEYLNTLLSESAHFTDDYLKKIIAEYLADCEKNKSFEWSYYYIKYKYFRPARYGKYFWADFENAPYLFEVYWTEQRRSENAYQPFLRALVDEETFQQKYNPELARLEFGKYYIECENDAYVVKKIETNELVESLKISQCGGVDLEDRIAKFKNWSKKNIYCV